MKIVATGEYYTNLFREELILNCRVMNKIGFGYCIFLPTEIIRLINNLYIRCKTEEKKIICNPYQSTMIITNKGKLYTTGALFLQERYSSKLFIDHKIENVIDIAVGDCHSMILTKEKLSFYYFTLHNKKVKMRSYFKSSNVLAISSGSTHAMILMKEGLYSWGSNNYGELGIGNTDKYPTNIIYDISDSIDINDDIEQIGLYHVPINNVISFECSANTTFVLTKEGLFICGYTGAIYDNEPNPNNVRIGIMYNLTNIGIDNVLSFSSYSNHALILTTEGLFKYGTPYHYNNAIFTKTRTGVRLYKIDLSNIVSFSCNHEFSLILTKDGLYASGYNTTSQFGYKDKDIKRYLVKLDIQDVISFDCGAIYSVVLTKNGLFVVGDNSNGQIGIGETFNTHTFIKIDDKSI